MTREQRLAAHVAAASGPVVWGESDCTAWPARWVEGELGRAVPMPTYASREQAHALMAKVGGLVPLCESALAQIGLWSTEAPQHGDVGVIRLSDRDCGVIFCHGGYVLVRNDAGGVLCLTPKTILRAWSVPCAAA